MSFVFVGLVACGGGKKGPSADELVKQLSPVIEPKLVTIEKILKEPFPAPTESLKVDGPPIEMIRDAGEGKVAGNALYAFENDLRSIERFQRNPLRYNFNGEIVNHCFMIVRKQLMAGGDFEMHSQDPRSWKGAEHLVGMNLPHCAALRYLLVIKLDAFKDTEYIDDKSFGGGGALAQVHVFDLDAGGKHAGGVSFVAESSRSVRGDTTQDLRGNFYRALQTAVAKHLPDARL